jgi:hypothetical protein
MNAVLPYHMYVYVDNGALGFLDDDGGGWTPAILHALHSRPGEFMYAHVLLETGAHWSRMPLSRIAWKLPAQEPTDQEPWGGMGERMTIDLFPALEGLRGQTVNGKDPESKNKYFRHTGMVIDWLDGYSRYPQEHKPLSLLMMDDGSFGLLPNNYFIVQDLHFTNHLDERSDDIKRYRRGEYTYHEDNTHYGSTYRKNG